MQMQELRLDEASLSAAGELPVAPVEAPKFQVPRDLDPHSRLGLSSCTSLSVSNTNTKIAAYPQVSKRLCQRAQAVMPRKPLHQGRAGGKGWKAHPEAEPRKPVHALFRQTQLHRASKINNCSSTNQCPASNYRQISIQREFY